MDQTRTTDKVDAGQEAVAAAILRLGEATAAALAEAAGIAYSTTTKKLRLLEAAGRLEAFKGDDGRTLWRATTAPAPADPADADATAAPAPSTERDDEPEPTAPDPVKDGDTPPPTETEPAETEPTAREAADTSDSGVATPETTVHSPGANEASDTDGSTEAGEATDGDTDAAEAAVHATDATTAEQTGSTEPVAPDVDAGADGERVADSGEKPNAGLESAGPEADQAAQNGPNPVRGTVVDGSTPTVDDNASAAGARRRPGTLIESIRTIMRANPDSTYRVGQLCKLIDQANEGTGTKKASPGAVKNQLDKLGGNGEIVMVVEHPATFQLATTT